MIVKSPAWNDSVAICFRYAHGCTMNYLANKYNCSIFTIRNILKANNIKTRNYDDHYRMIQSYRKYDHDRNDEEIINLINEGKSIAEVCKLTGYTRPTIRKIISINNNSINDNISRELIYEKYHNNEITAKKAASYGGFLSIKSFKRGYDYWVKRNDN